MASSRFRDLANLPRQRAFCLLHLHFTTFAALCTCALALLVLVAGCQRGPSLSPLGPDAVVLAFGDSLTHGNGAADGRDYPAQLQRLIGRRVVNAGIPGEVTAEGRRRLPQVLDEVRPDLLVLCHGGNDFLRHSSEKRAAANLAAMIEAARGRGIEVLLVGVPRPGLLLAPAPFYEELADQYGIPCEDEILSDILADRDLKSDPIHPNADGYRRLAAAIAETLEKAGAI